MDPAKCGRLRYLQSTTFQPEGFQGHPASVGMGSAKPPVFFSFQLLPVASPVTIA